MLQVMLSLSENQIEDILFLRRIFLVGRHNFDARRAALAGSMQGQGPNHLADVAKTSTVASQLRQNASEHREFLVAWGRTVYYGVCC